MAAQTYLCYGIPVTNESLTYATMAYEKLDGPFRFIRLVQKRVREGTLQTSPASAASSLPVELWDLVRHKVTDVELCAAERKFLNIHACAHSKRWTDLIRCEDCFDTITSYKGFGDPALTKKCRRLLHDYGLDMPSTRVLKTSQPDSLYSAEGDPDSVAFVALSLTSDRSRIDADDHVSCRQPKVVDMDNYHNDGIWPVSLDKPADADQRFRHLLRDLHLTPLRVSDGSIGIARATDTTGTRAYEKISAAEVQPQWHLFTTVECDW